MTWAQVYDWFWPVAVATAWFFCGQEWAKHKNRLHLQAGRILVTLIEGALVTRRRVGPDGVITGTQMFGPVDGQIIAVTVTEEKAEAENGL